MHEEYCIEKYALLLRDAVNSAIVGIEFSDFLSEARKLLGYKYNDDWVLLTCSLDLLEDTELAKKNYYKFQLPGPTRYEDIGENYLRLYGVLNSVYLQKNAVFELSELFDIQNKVVLNKAINNLAVCKLRNIAGSHTTNYHDWESKSKQSFMVARYSLNTNKIRVVPPKGNYLEFELTEVISEFNKRIEDYLDIILAKFIASVFRKTRGKHRDYTKRLERIRKERQGDIFIDFGNKTFHVSLTPSPKTTND